MMMSPITSCMKILSTSRLGIQHANSGWKLISALDWSVVSLDSILNSTLKLRPNLSSCGRTYCCHNIGTPSASPSSHLAFIRPLPRMQGWSGRIKSCWWAGVGSFRWPRSEPKIIWRFIKSTDNILPPVITKNRAHLLYRLLVWVGNHYFISKFVDL